MKDIKVASVQFEHKNGDKAYNLKRIQDFARQASQKEVDLIVFPECCITGCWFIRNLSKSDIAELAEDLLNGPSVKEISRISSTNNIIVCAGLIENFNGEFYNTYIVAMPDGTLKFHRKIHCFINKHMSSGNDYTIIETPFGWKIGVLICYDNNIIENTRITTLMGANVIIAPHQTGGCRTKDPNIMGIVDSKLWNNRHEKPKEIEMELKGEKGRGWLLRWLPSRAHDNGVFYIFSNGIGKDDDEIRTGNAMVIDPYGRIISETWKAADEMIIAKFDSKLLLDNTGQRWITARRPSLYTTISEPTRKEVDIFTARFSGKGA
ncbi:nitrilase-related carbon-nitrogen hydrolase [Flagellimonas sp.]|uniref:nitrilase-related carbon-nitrogen hydrolase n=1 Tax=Flagellimonas sp. TaxID=2058762 RepID=UPI003BB0D0B8